MEEQNVSCEVLTDETVNEVPITPQEYNDILHIQQKLLTMISTRNSSTQVLEELCLLAEKLLPNSVASIMFKDVNTNLMSVLSAPSIPEVGHQALKDLQPGPGGGSCGNAVFRNEAQYVHNTFEDARWTDLRNIAIDFNLCSCWSMPVRDENNNAVGTFALSSFEHRKPAPFHKKLLETAASIVSIVLRNQDNEKRLQLFAAATQNASEGIIITDADNNIIEVNEAFEKIYGYTEAEVLGKNPRILSSQRHKKSFYDTMWHKINTTANWSGEIINKLANGDEITQWMSISALKDDSNNYLAIFSDITELKKTQEKIEKMAYEDSLTKLHNKTQLEVFLAKDEEQTLILLNVNNFSYINTAYGFDFGDKLLISIADILNNDFCNDHTCRINSDEFALVFDKKIDVEEVVTRIKKYFYSKEIQVEDITLNVSFSYGGVYGNKNLLRNAALALKQAKENGKNTLYIFNQDEDSIDHSAREQFIESNKILHNALLEDRVIPYFQGIRDNATGKLTKYESLARIIKDGKIISPFMFIEPARLAGLLPEITRVMIDKSFDEMQDKEYIFSINITEEDLSRNYLIEYLKEKSALYKISPSRVILEILEGISSNGKKNHIKQLNTLKELGFKIAIDDFGSEYSNFERVLDLDIDFLKIDARYIKDIDTNEKSLEITRAIVFFAKNAGIPCIAEFVHNENVQRIVQDLGIEYSQGFYFSEPQPFS